MPIKAMEDSVARGPYDELYTPFEALRYLLPYLPQDQIIWESAPGALNIVHILQAKGYQVVWQERDYFEWEPDRWDIQVTNPPFSIKAQWLERAQILEKPFAILLPVSSIGARNVQLQLQDVQLLLLPRRIDFTGKKAPWFAVAWYTKGLNLPYPLTVSRMELS